MTSRVRYDLSIAVRIDAVMTARKDPLMLVALLFQIRRVTCILACKDVYVGVGDVDVDGDGDGDVDGDVDVSAR